MAQSKWAGMYEYKGFTIWNTGEKDWIAEPNAWSIAAIENLKYHAPELKTINEAKKWVREIGSKLNESDYLKQS